MPANDTPSCSGPDKSPERLPCRGVTVAYLHSTAASEEQRGRTCHQQAVKCTRLDTRDGAGCDELAGMFGWPQANLPAAAYLSSRLISCWQQQACCTLLSSHARHPIAAAPVQESTTACRTAAGHMRMLQAQAQITCAHKHWCSQLHLASNASGGRCCSYVRCCIRIRTG